MPRKPREEVEGGIYHVFARGNDKRLIYRDDIDRRTYLSMLRGTVRQCRWRLFAYCLMDNHVHLLVETPEPNLGSGMQRLHGLYAREFNTRHRRSGHLFQGRYGAVRIKTDAQLWTVAVYVAMNPVKAGLCARPQDWPWSSHTMCEGSDPLRVVEGCRMPFDDEKRADEDTLPDTPLHTYRDRWEEEVEGDVDRLQSGDPETSLRTEVSDGEGEQSTSVPDQEKH